MRVYLIGVGVVGREILRAHLDAGIPVCAADQNEIHLRESIDQLQIDHHRMRQTHVGRFPAIEIDQREITTSPGSMVIESISERLDIKQSLFRTCERLFGPDAILCSNTSTLRIGHIAAKLEHPERLCGMHFFMPVHQRDAVEVVRGDLTDAETLEACCQHVQSLGKSSLVVGDGPGFIVNRLLCPYLNEALLLLGEGVTAEQVERAALAYGMPMSPFELMDWIGIRTVFDAGRVFWQSFPGRMEPSPIPPALIKAQRFGRQCGRGCYDYQEGERTHELSPATKSICQRYRRGDAPELSDEEVMMMLSVPMWIEAAHAFRDRVATSPQQFDLALRGGLGFQSQNTWLEFFETLGMRRIREFIKRHSTTRKSLQVSPEFRQRLEGHCPTQIFADFAAVS